MTSLDTARAASHRASPSGHTAPRSGARRYTWAAAALLGSAITAQAAQLSVRVHFNGPNGRAPHAGLTRASDGTLYGTTSLGGSQDCGTVFKLTPAGKHKLLHSLNCTLEGSSLQSPVTLGSDGLLYGTIRQGGANGLGSAFSATTKGVIRVLTPFDGINGQLPDSGIVEGADGNFYGMAGNRGYGTSYRFSRDGQLVAVAALGPPIGSGPLGELLLASDGYFYGTLASGGQFSAGAIVRLDATGGSLTLVASLDRLTTGAGPASALIEATDGYLYGTASGGGPLGGGTVFRVDRATGSVQTLWTFDSHSLSSGRDVFAPVVQGTDGQLYGTTAAGGKYGHGTVYRLTLTGQLKTLFSFDGKAKGGMPFAPLTQGSDGAFYGTTVDGGLYSGGVLFRIVP